MYFGLLAFSISFHLFLTLSFTERTYTCAYAFIFGAIAYKYINKCVRHASCLDIFICLATDWFTNAIKLYYMFGINLIFYYFFFFFSLLTLLLKFRLLLCFRPVDKKESKRKWEEEENLKWNGIERKRLIFTKFRNLQIYSKKKMKLRESNWYL